MVGDGTGFENRRGESPCEFDPLTLRCSVAQLSRAPVLHAGGHRFKSDRGYHQRNRVVKVTDCNPVFVSSILTVDL